MNSEVQAWAARSKHAEISPCGQFIYLRLARGKYKTQWSFTGTCLDYLASGWRSAVAERFRHMRRELRGVS